MQLGTHHKLSALCHIITIFLQCCNLNLLIHKTSKCSSYKSVLKFSIPASSPRKYLNLYCIIPYVGLFTLICKGYKRSLRRARFICTGNEKNDRLNMAIGVEGGTSSLLNMQANLLMTLSSFNLIASAQKLFIQLLKNLLLYFILKISCYN